MRMDLPALGALLGFSVQIAAGIAPMKWPQHAWLAHLIFWGACVFGVLSVLSWLFTNGILTLDPRSLIIVGLVIALIGVGWQYWRQPPTSATATPEVTAPGKPDISWNFDSGQPVYFIGFAKADIPDFTKTPPTVKKGDLYVAGFQASGTNNLDVPLLDVSGYIRSDVTNETIPINFNIDHKPVPTKDTYGIPPSATFDITTVSVETIDMNNLDKVAIPWSRFAVDFAHFTFVFMYDGKKFTRHFSREEVLRQFDLFQNVLDPSKNPAPRVTRKSSTAN
jgi:hypothetical protein